MRIRTPIQHAFAAALGLWAVATTQALLADQPAGFVRISDGRAPHGCVEPKRLPGAYASPGACQPGAVSGCPGSGCPGAGCPGPGYAGPGCPGPGCPDGACEATAIHPAHPCCLGPLACGAGMLGQAGCCDVLGGYGKLLGRCCLTNGGLLGGCQACGLLGGHDSDGDVSGAYYTYNPDHPACCCNLALSMLNPLGGGTHSPDHGWSPPVKYPVYRVPVIYHRYWPERWYGEPGSGISPTAPRFPMVYMPTDTTQLGFYYQRVPQWLPNPTMVPPAPWPAAYHNRMPAPYQNLQPWAAQCCHCIKGLFDDDEAGHYGGYGHDD